MGDYMLTAILLGCNAVMGGVVFFEWQMSQAYQSKMVSDRSETTPSTIAIEEIPTLNEILKPKGLYDDIVARPLFVEGRQPIESTEEDTLSSFNGKVTIILKGVVSTPDGMIALLEDKEKKRYRLRMGDEVEGWEIAELQSDKVILKKNGNQKELLLWIPKPSKKNDNKKPGKSRKKPGKSKKIPGETS